MKKLPSPLDLLSALKEADLSAEDQIWVQLPNGEELIIQGFKFDDCNDLLLITK